MHCKRLIALLGSALFLVFAPGTVAGLVPWWITDWQFRPAWFGLAPLRAAGACLILTGLPGLIDCFARFALEGLGTPAPIAPPGVLVVSGLYRYVRNPMYVSVVALVLGQSLLFADRRLAVYGAVVWGVFHLFVVAYEEPVLLRTFGDSYDAYRARVPRWLPRCGRRAQLRRPG